MEQRPQNKTKGIRHGRKDHKFYSVVLQERAFWFDHSHCGFWKIQKNTHTANNDPVRDKI